MGFVVQAGADILDMCSLHWTNDSFSWAVETKRILIIAVENLLQAMHRENHCDNKDRVFCNGNFTKHNTTYFRSPEWKTKTPPWCFCVKIGLAEIILICHWEFCFCEEIFLVTWFVEVLKFHYVDPETQWKRCQENWKPSIDIYFLLHLILPEQGLPPPANPTELPL